MFDFFIDNVRSFQRQSFRFKKINILIGENSGGKSSLIKFLLALKQSLEFSSNSNLILSGEYADLGGFKETIRNHNRDLSLNFGFSFKTELKYFFNSFMFRKEDSEESRKRILSVINPAFEVQTGVFFTIPNDLEKHSSIGTMFTNKFLGELKIKYVKKSDEPKDSYDILAEIPKCLIEYDSKIHGEKIIIDEVEFEKKGFLSIIKGNSLAKICQNLKLPNSIYYELAIFLLTQNLLDFEVSKIKYLNPLVSKPERIYINKDSQSQYKTGSLGKFTHAVKQKEISQKLLNRFNKMLFEFGIADKIEVKSPSDFAVSELRVKVKNLISNVSDVGYGVALQIPILFEALISEENSGSSLIIEQPEVHLHPKLQAKFIETLLKIGNSNSYIIETHSEYIIRRLQIIVKNKEYNINNEDVGIYYFTRNEDLFSVTEHPLDVNGKLTIPFPSGFYDNSFELTKGLMF